jgi:hypothetical protein
MLTVSLNDVYAKTFDRLQRNKPADTEKVPKAAEQFLPLDVQTVTIDAAWACHNSS